MNHTEKFMELLSDVAKGVNFNQVFNDFLKISAASLANFCCVDSTLRLEREKLFKDTVNRYDADARVKFVDMLSELMLALNENVYSDVLGDVFNKLNLNERNNGQVFTPPHIGLLAGELVFDELDKKDFVTVVEPCCGSGAVVVNSLNALLAAGINPSRQCLVTAYDLDERCVLMTFIQLSLYGITATVSVKNAVTDEQLGAAWQTFQSRIR